MAEVAQEEEDPQSPLHLPKEELPSTKLEELSEESDPPELSLAVGSEELSPIEYPPSDPDRS
jgi:hypothetical protein